MSLRINHNLAALNANRNLKLTNAALSKSMQKLSSGFRINAAADDPAGLVISEQFRSQIAGLNRAIQNSEGSISMIQTAEGALTEINNLLISMRELAIHAANEGFNDTDQLAADQAEIENAIKTIDRIAANTQFGTKKILDGTKDNIATITSSDTAGINLVKSSLTTGTHSVAATKTADSSATLNTSGLGLSLANSDGDPVNLTERIHNIDVVQASDVAKKLSSTFSMVDAFANGVNIATTALAASMITTGHVATIGLAAGAPAGTVGVAGNYELKLDYAEKGGSAVGTQTIAFTLEAGDAVSTTVVSKIQTALDANVYLSGKFNVWATASAGGASTEHLHIDTANVGADYSMKIESVTNLTGTAAGTKEAFSITAGDARGTSENTLRLKVITDQWSTGRTALATIASGTYTDIDALITAMNTGLRTQSSGGGARGAFGTIAGAASTNDVVATKIGTNQIQLETRDEGSDYSIQLLDDAVMSTGDLRHALGFTVDTLAVTGTDALVSFDNYSNSITSVKYASTGTATLYDSSATAENRGMVDMIVSNALNGIRTGNLLLDVKAAKFDVRLDGGPATSVTAGVNTNIFNAARSESIRVKLDLDAVGGSETINNTDQSLVFQIGANVGQTARIGIRNMASSSLAKNISGNMFASLSEMDVTTVQGAQDAQSLIDVAILQVSTTRGELGTFQKNTLESNLRNLRIASQNLTASESQIRDTDMASEMSEFTKNQILMQTGMAMLAQSNQIPQVVLSLF